MKLEIACILLAVLLLLCACAQPLLSTDTTAPQTDEKPELTTILMTDLTAPTATEGAKYDFRYYFGMDTKLCLLDDAQMETLTTLAETTRTGTYPTFPNPYPSDHGGPEYPIDAALNDREREAGERFLRECIGSTEEALQFEVDGDLGNYVTYTGSAMKLTVWPDSMKISDFSGFAEDFTPEAVLNEPMVKAAMQWLAIDTPHVWQSAVPESDCTLASQSIMISQQDDDVLQQLLNDTFRSVTVKRTEEDGGVTVSFSYGELPEGDGEAAVDVTDEQLKALFDSFFGDEGPEEYYIQIVYSPRVDVGRFVPCCRIYTPEPDCPPVDGKTVCTVSNLSFDFISGFSEPLCTLPLATEG